MEEKRSSPKQSTETKNDPDIYGEERRISSSTTWGLIGGKGMPPKTAGRPHPAEILDPESVSSQKKSGKMTFLSLKFLRQIVFFRKILQGMLEQNHGINQKEEQETQQVRKVKECP